MTDHRSDVAVAVTRKRPGHPIVIAFDEPGAAGPRWADRLGPGSRADLGWIALDDPDGSGFYGGIPGLGSTIEEAARSLRERIAEFAPGQVVTLGNGIAGHAALIYGVLLGADRIVAVEPLAHLIDEVLEQYHDRRTHPGLIRKPEQTLARRWDVADLLSRSDFRGEVHVLLGSRRVNAHADAVHQHAIHAEWLARSPRVRLHRFDQLAPGLVEVGNDHETVNTLITQLLIEEAAPAPRSSPSIRLTPRPRALVYDAKLTVCRFGADNPMNRTGAAVSFAAVGPVDETATRKMSDELRRWIVENLLLDASPDDLAKNLLPLGISRRETLREVDLARFHPYFLATRRPIDRLAKRDWQLATYRKLDRLRRRPGEIERRTDLSGAEFLKTYYSTGRPVLLPGAVAGWPALQAWTFADLARRLGASEVSLTADGGQSATMPLTDALAALKDPRGGPTWTLQGDENGANRDFWLDLRADVGPFPEGFPFLELHRASCWFGPKGASPPPPDEGLPAFVAQVVGRVRAELVLSWDVELTTDRTRTTPIGLSQPASPTSFPPLDQPEILDFALNPGDLLFLPAGCRCRFVCLEPAASVAFAEVYAAPGQPHQAGER